MKPTVSVIALSAAALALLGGCNKSAAPADAQSEIEAIGAVQAQLQAAYQARDAAALAALYTDDATLYLPGEARPRVGRAAIADGAKQDFADPAFHITMTTGKVGAFTPGNAGYAKGSFTVRYTDPQTKGAGGHSGYFLTIFVKDADGQWRISEDMTTPAG